MLRTGRDRRITSSCRRGVAFRNIVTSVGETDFRNIAAPVREVATAASPSCRRNHDRNVATPVGETATAASPPRQRGRNRRIALLPERGRRRIALLREKPRPPHRLMATTGAPTFRTPAPGIPLRSRRQSGTRSGATGRNQRRVRRERFFAASSCARLSCRRRRCVRRNE